MLEGEFPGLTAQRFEPGTAAFGRCLDTLTDSFYLLRGISVRPLVGGKPALRDVHLRVLVARRVVYEGPAADVHGLQSWHCPPGSPVELHVSNEGKLPFEGHFTCLWEPWGAPVAVDPLWGAE